MPWTDDEDEHEGYRQAVAEARAAQKAAAEARRKEVSEGVDSDPPSE